MASWELTAVSNCSAFEASHRVKNCGASQQDKLGSLRSARFENSKGVHHPFSHIILLSHPPETAVDFYVVYISIHISYIYTHV
jgi:hypothetical protein